MFIVFEQVTGELTYLADGEALHHLDADRYDWIEVAADLSWQQTHVWNPNSRSLEQFP